MIDDGKLYTEEELIAKFGEEEFRRQINLGEELRQLAKNVGERSIISDAIENGYITAQKGSKYEATVRSLTKRKLLKPIYWSGKTRYYASKEGKKYVTDFWDAMRNNPIEDDDE